MNSARPDWIQLPEILGTTVEVVLASHPAAVVHFWAEWNRHDRTMAHRLATIASRFAGRAEFFACDTDRAENAELCRQLGGVNLPWLVVFVAGQPRERIVGLRDPEVLTSLIEVHLR